MPRKKQAQPQAKNVAKYEPDDREQAALDRYNERVEKAQQAPRVKVDGDRLEVDHHSPAHGCMLLMESLGTTSLPFASATLKQLVNALSVGKNPDQEAVNYALAVIAGARPQDELETMLVAQMAAIHCTTMTFARRLNHVESIEQQNSAERTLNKLARTFTTQLEALKRYRTGGEQKVVVQHVNVNDGGQAIVGTVERAKDRGEGCSYAK